MPAGSGHGFVQLVSCGLHRFPLAESCKNASVLARECSFLTLLVYDRARRSRISRSAEGLTAGHTEATQGAALDLRFFEKNRVKLYLCNLLMGVAFIDTLSAPEPPGMLPLPYRFRTARR